MLTGAGTFDASADYRRINEKREEPTMDRTTTPTKGEVLVAIDRERESWENLLAEVGEERMLEPGAMGEWTFKDLVAHISGWRARSLQRLEAASLGQPEPEPAWPAVYTSDDEVDAWLQEVNAWLHEVNKDRLLGEVVGESRESFARLAAIVQMLPDEALSDPSYFPWLEGSALGAAIVDGEFFSHFPEEHEADVRQWMQATG